MPADSVGRGVPVTYAHFPSDDSGGFTLIEVQIALLVLSIGLLGIAGLQIGGLFATRGAEQGSIATMLVRDMADRLRGNPVGLMAGLYDAIGSLQSIDPAGIAPQDLQCIPD